jgi:disulfide bond formation protein DsbB
VKSNCLYTLLAAVVLILTIVPIGSAVFLLGFIHGDSPCVMCWEQRTGMAIIALLGLFVLRYGPRPRYIGLSVLVGAWGIFMGLRHTGMHAARDVGQGFSIEIMGAHTYTWALFVFWCCVVTMGVLLLIMKEGEPAVGTRALRPLDKLAAAVFLIVIAGNIVQAFASTGPPPFVGQGDPVRFSFHPGNWVWSLDEWSYAPASLRGRWAIEKAGVEGLPADPGAGPLANLQPLAVREQKKLGFSLRGSATDLAYDGTTDRFLITTQNGIYIADGALSRIVRWTLVDPGFSIDVGNFAGAAFLDSTTVMALGENKSYVILRENDGADARGNFRYFLESFDRFDEVSRSRLTTVRARMMYVSSLAFDRAANSIYAVTVPNSKVRRMVCSRFDRRDLTLSEEFSPVLGPSSGLQMSGAKRSLDELYITGATLAEGLMYAVSAAYQTLLTIDLASHTVIAAHSVPVTGHPIGVALKNGDLYILTGGGDIYIAAKP